MFNLIKSWFACYSENPQKMPVRYSDSTVIQYLFIAFLKAPRDFYNERVTLF